MRGCIGEGCEGEYEIRILNRVITLTDKGLVYEADPRHCDLLKSSLNLSQANAACTLGSGDQTQ